MNDIARLERRFYQKSTGLIARNLNDDDDDADIFNRYKFASSSLSTHSMVAIGKNSMS